MKTKIEIAPEIAAAAPDYKVVILEADVTNSPTPEALTSAIEAYGTQLTEIMGMDDIKNRPGIAATRAVYRRLGKEPNRYRPSHEQMMRRFFKGQGLYTVNALVDSGNLLSLMSGYSVGVFDAAKIDGDTLTVGVGREGEPYEGIGRGPLNIAGLPVVRDASGGIGTPTSDNERTKIELSTRHIVATIHIFGEDMSIDSTVKLARDLLSEYCSATSFEFDIISVKRP